RRNFYVACPENLNGKDSPRAENFDEADTKIVGGFIAKPNQFPFQVALYYKGSLRCGGSIIDPSWILTAAHCVGVEQLSILAGSNILGVGGSWRNVVETIIHEDYGNFKNDIALMRLDRPLNFSDSIQSVELLEENIPALSEVTICGWGRTSNIGFISTLLKYNVIEKLDNKNCSFATPTFNFDGVLCLGHSINNGACNGDSGGSAIYNGKLCGLANFVVGGCGSSFPDGYAKISYYIDWIKQKMLKYDENEVKSFIQSKMTARIIGGWEAEPHQFTSQVVVYIERNEKKSLCGGTIIERCWVITKASCFHDDDLPQMITVHAGTHSINYNGTTRKVKRIITHENFSQKDNRNDIALVELKKCLTYSKSIKKAELEKTFNPMKKEVTVVGYGNSEDKWDNGVESNVLKYNKLKLMSVENCKKYALTFSHPGKFCLKQTKNNAVCYGDAGGGAFCDGKLCGITSIIFKPCTAVRPSLYTKISYYYKWIRRFTHRYRSITKSARISGGWVAKPRQFPSQVIIFIRRNEYSTECTGTIIERCLVINLIKKLQLASLHSPLFQFYSQINRMRMQENHKILTLLTFICIINLCTTKERKNARIMGGQDAEKNQFPSQVIINRGDKYACTGSIIERCWVITAASCFKNGQKDISVVAGTNSRKVGGIEKEVKKIFIHENFSAKTYENDIALLKLKECLNFKKKKSIRKIKFSNRSDEKMTEVIVVGWGNTSPLTEPSLNLKYTKLKAMMDFDCREMSDSYNYPGMFCLVAQNGSASCNGDVGGGVICDGILCGITSFVFRPCGSKTPSIYTRVSHYCSWIWNTINHFIQSEMTARMYGGWEAKSHQFPSQVVVYFKRNEKESFCGGTIIERCWVLTAASCFRDNDIPQFVTIKAGTHSVAYGGTERKVKRIITHENFSQKDRRNDIALVELKKCLTYTKSIKKAELEKTFNPMKKEVTIAGFGFGTDGNHTTSSAILKYNKLKLMSTENCQKHSSLFYHPGKFCLKQTNINGACKGDVGGGAFCDGKLCGITSFMFEPCGRIVMQQSNKIIKTTTTLMIIFAFNLSDVISSRKSARISGGWVAKPRQFPSQVIIFIRRNEYSTECTGTIIERCWVITAAACFRDSDPLVNITIKAGISNSIDRNGARRKVKRIVIHEKYANNPRRNDIALVELKKCLSYRKSIKKAELERSFNPMRREVTISGYGISNKNDGVISTVLKYNKLELMSMDSCHNSNEDFNHSGIFCLKQTRRKGACYGDLGGGAFCDGKLCGIASIIYQYCASIRPSGYMKISHYYKWIRRFTHRHRSNTGDKYACTGSIIERCWVITAASCFKNGQKDISVVAGTNSRKVGGIEKEVKKIFIHENFSAKTYENDIALLKLKECLNFKKKKSIRKIKFSNRSDEKMTEVIVVGWGNTSPLTEPSLNLKYTKLKAMMDFDCREMSDSYNYPGMFCLVAQNGSASCNGDVGGGVICDGILCGITSFVFRPCGSKTPSIYTRVSHYCSWIWNTINHGSVIDKCWVITAASCFNGVEMARVTVKAGTNDIYYGGIPKEVEKIIIHENYDVINMQYDIALLKLQSCFKLGKTIKKIKLDKKFEPLNNEVTIVGWGSTFDTVPNEWLRHNTLKIMGDYQCQYTSKVYDHPGIFCLIEDKTGACDGDKGGAAICDEKLCGITSIIAHPCAGRNQFSSQVIVKWKKRFACTGNIISRCWVLTVASCFDVDKPQNVSIVAGTNVNGIGGTKRKVARVIIHEQYMQSVNKFDIALLELKKCLNLNDYNSIMKIKLINKKPGSTYTETCHKISARYNHPGIFCLHQRFYAPTGFHRPCLAGKGGAAICNGTLCGLGSIICEKCFASTPLGYTNLNYFRPWIESSIETKLE
ncbi:CLUMA_CG016525, isoform A, partial [Clunio marinus]